jgi:hypothetical protein
VTMLACSIVYICCIYEVSSLRYCAFFLALLYLAVVSHKYCGNQPNIFIIYNNRILVRIKVSNPRFNGKFLVIDNLG